MRWRGLLLVACVGMLLVTAWYAGSRLDPPPPRPPAGTVRLGPEPAEPVAGYLARLPAELPAPGVPVLALVQLGAEVTPDEVVRLVDGAPAPADAAPPTGAPGSPAEPPAGIRGLSVAPVSVVFHVPLPRVQTALRFVPLEAGMSLPAGLAAAREHARFVASGDADRRTGRTADVAAAEAAVLADPVCRCVVALVVSADRAGLDALSAWPGVRAVHAAPTGVTAPELALSPLLPEQVERADPPPDDGPVPTAAPS